jgi:hypothetical protein
MDYIYVFLRLVIVILDLPTIYFDKNSGILELGLKYFLPLSIIFVMQVSLMFDVE